MPRLFRATPLQTRFVRAVVFALYATCLLCAPLAAAPLRQETPTNLNASLSSAFTYQGKLAKGGLPVTAACSMTFSLFDALTAGTKIGNDQAINPVLVSDGLFTVVLNGGDEFGANAFDGNVRFLQVTILCAGDASAVNLPRQQLMAAPYALTSISAESAKGLQGRPVSTAAPITGQALAWDGTKWAPQTLDSAGAQDWSSLSGIPADFADNVDNDSGGDITGVSAGSGLSGGGNTGNVSLALDTGVTDSRYWQLDGNSGLPATAFLGTNDSAALTLGVSNTTALRIIPAVDSNSDDVGASIIGGSAENTVAPGVAAAVIAGGGSTNPGSNNEVFDNYGVIGGGTGNTAGLDDDDVVTQASAVVGGGNHNRASAENATIPGGQGALASLFGQFAYASGEFSNNSVAQAGSAQTSIYVLRGEGSDDLTLHLDGKSNGQSLQIRAKSAMVFSIYLIGIANNADITAAYHFDGVVSSNDAGTIATLLVSNRTPLFVSTVTPGSGLDAALSTDADALVISVHNGVDSNPDMRWVATVYATEVVGK